MTTTTTTRNEVRWEWPPVDHVANELERIASTAMVDRMAMCSASGTLASLCRKLGHKLVLRVPSPEAYACQGALAHLAVCVVFAADRLLTTQWQDGLGKVRAVVRQDLARELTAAARAAHAALIRLGPVLESRDGVEDIVPARLAALRALARLAGFDIELLLPAPRLARGTRG